MDYRDTFIQEYLTTHRWAMQRQVLDSLCGIVERHMTGEKLSEEQIRQITGAQRSVEDPRKYEMLAEGTAMIHVTGVIAKYSRMVNGVSQARGTSCEFLSQQLSLAMSDARVKKIFLRIESPGGSVPGLPDFADEIYQASFEKPIIAFADDRASSAAYWIGSQANAFYANQSAMVGSIGVYTVIPDSSQRAEMMGVKFNVISTGSVKGAGYPGSPVTEEQLNVFKESVDGDFKMFLDAVLRGRAASGLDAESLQEAADGREFSAAAAKDKKLIDAVMTLDAALALDPPELRESGTVAAASAENHTHHFNGKEQIMSDTKTTKATADAAEEVKAPTASVEQERSRILGIQSALAGAEFASIRDKAIAEGWDLQTAKSAAFDVAQTARTTEAKAAAEKLAEAQTRLDAIANSGHDDTLAAAPDTTVETPLKQDNSQAGSAEAYEKAVQGYKEAGMELSMAHRKAQKNSPADHAAWVSAQQKK